MGAGATQTCAVKQKFHAAVRNVYRHAMRHANALSDATNVQAYDGNFISVTFMRHRVAHGDDIPTFHPTAHDPLRRHRRGPDRCANGPPAAIRADRAAAKQRRRLDDADPRTA
ncbi:hypothetical protein SPHINGOT1_260176 [Sphingomonas sp. T1]|nr:hypothetical protein SPHINGOT1_260176 [Sphingomonas sp. T1]